MFVISCIPIYSLLFQFTCFKFYFNHFHKNLINKSRPKSKKPPPPSSSLPSFHCFTATKPMMQFLKKNLSFLHLSSSFSSATHNPPSKSHFVIEYLINSCGFNPEKAATVSKHLKFTTHSKPDSVRHFLKHNAGFTDANIRSIISRDYRVLTTNVDNVMEPNFKALLKIPSWSISELQQVIISNPSILIRSHVISCLEFWKNFLNGDMKKLLVAVKRNIGLFAHDINKGVTQKIAVLNEHGISHTDIGFLLVRGNIIFTRSIDSTEVLLKKLEEMGLARGSPMFLRSLLCLSHIGLDTFNAKMEVYTRYGWSKSEFIGAFQKAPSLACLSEENIREKMEFLVERAGCQQSYIVSHPVVLFFSLEKRLIPRTHVMDILESANLLRKRMDLYSVLCLTESKFTERFIQKYKEKMPEIRDIYAAACAGQLRL